MEFAIAKVSTKGQIVIPVSLRKDILDGDEFLVVKDEGRLVLKSMKGVAADLRDDLLFAQRIEAAWKDRAQGKFIKKSKGDFLQELRSC
jgi:bifunctional DNA-binding transcriptional regulator/antitoxin component of YhaV-PrlF toxin-antitoxin module